MRIINYPSLSPCRNLAAEEYLTDHADGDVFMLWRNGRSVIIGRNQNAWAEINTDYARENGITVVRRLTGGGAVFHDPGNVNYTFITDAAEDAGIDFAGFTAPMIKALRSLGINAELNGRNDITADGVKISGNAQCRRRTPEGRTRILHHGTLLYDADLTSLAGVLRPDPAKLSTKGIRSIASRVNNIRALGGLSMTTEEFMAYLTAFAESEFGGRAEYGVTPAEADAIAALTEAKYATWEWNFGKSPEHEENRRRRFQWGTAELGYTVKQGVIQSITLTGDFFGTEDTAILTDALTGCRFTPDAVSAALSEIPVSAVISGAATEDVVDLLFNVVV